MTIRNMSLNSHGKWTEVISGETKDMHNCTEYVAMINKEFCGMANCYVQLMLAVERKLPAFIFIKNGVVIPEDIQKLLDKTNIYYKKIVPANEFPNSVEEMKIFMEKYNSVIMEYVNNKIDKEKDNE